MSIPQCGRSFIGLSGKLQLAEHTASNRDLMIEVTTSQTSVLIYSLIHETIGEFVMHTMYLNLYNIDIYTDAPHVNRRYILSIASHSF